MPRVLITGAAGFIGMHTSIRFLREGWDVIGLDNLNNYYSVELKKQRLNHIRQVDVLGLFTFLQFDLNSNVWEDELTHIDFEAVIHLAAQAGVRFSLQNPKVYLESNIIGFQKVLDFVEAHNIRKFLYASSSSVYGKNCQQPFTESQDCSEPESYYAATKKANELMAYSFFKTKGVVSVGLRFFTVYGPWGRPDMAPVLFAKAALNHTQIQIYNHGRQKRDFTFIDDIVEGVYRLTIKKDFVKDAQIVNIGYGSPINLMEFIHLIEKEVGTELKKKFTKEQKGDVAETYASVKKLQSLINYSPQVDIQTGIKVYIKWFLEHHSLYS